MNDETVPPAVAQVTEPVVEQAPAPRLTERSPLEVACLQALSDVPFGERVTVRYDGQNFDAWLDAEVKLHIENRGI